MLLKDYYAILELEPPVTQAQIKTAYRKLAHLYHPDKNHPDPFARARFADIKEAYEVLTHPGKREKYLQLRWHNSSMGKKTTAESTTPVTLLKALLALERKISKTDQFRMNQHSLLGELSTIFSSENTEMLRLYADEAINQEIISTALRSMRLLSYEDAVNVTEKIRQISDTNAAELVISRFLLERKRSVRNERLTIPLVILIVIAICVLIYVSGR